MQLSNEEVKEAIIEWAAKRGIETKAENITFEAEDFQDDDEYDENGNMWTEVVASIKDVFIAAGPYR